MTEEKRIRLELNQNHPTDLEIMYASERLNQRIELPERLKKLKEETFIV